ncbi:MAG: hypothetical protein UH249_04540 [Acutalibacteraceae bacterium]|nr:hypothetical protein [Acutalibacteraceae bacterium]
MEINAVLLSIIRGVESTMNNNGFSVVVPQGTEKGSLPVTEKNGCTTILYGGKKGSSKIEIFEGKISLLCSVAEAENAVDEDYKKVTTTLFDVETVDDRDIKYVANEFCDCINDMYGKKDKAKKLPQPVSKAAAKSGSVYYDLVTLGSRFVQIYPDLKDAYKKNIEKYGEFLADDFFVNHGNEVFRATVKKNDPQQMKKLFNMLNEVYNDGTNQVQSVIVVTILGSLYDDETLLANCVDYMDEMTLFVIETNKILKKSSSTRAKLEHPPLYKPKKKKKPSAFMNQLNGGN